MRCGKPLRHREFNDRGLNCVERGKHPGDRARPGRLISRQQARMALRDMEHDGPRLEHNEIAFFYGRTAGPGSDKSSRKFADARLPYALAVGAASNR